MDRRQFGKALAISSTALILPAPASAGIFCHRRRLRRRWFRRRADWELAIDAPTDGSVHKVGTVLQMQYLDIKCTVETNGDGPPYRVCTQVYNGDQQCPDEFSYLQVRTMTLTESDPDNDIYQYTQRITLNRPRYQCSNAGLPLTVCCWAIEEQLGDDLIKDGDHVTISGQCDPPTAIKKPN